jgi:glutamine amidotransferase
MASLAVVPGGGENINSVLFALERLGVAPTLTVDARIVAAADRVILMGVGAALPAMAKLERNGLVACLRDLRQPVLGICIGMQLLFERSAEGDVECLGILSGTVRRFPEGRGLVVPHKGWNSLSEIRADNPLLRGISDGECAYFMHSYYVPVSACTIAASNHGVPIAAAVSERNYFGCQFHPERSGALGDRILTNFLAVQ